MFEELDTVVLNKNVKKHSLQKGDMGTVVHKYRGGVEVEFATARGKTIAILTLAISDLRKIKTDEILHVRPIASI